MLFQPVSPGGKRISVLGQQAADLPGAMQDRAKLPLFPPLWATQQGFLQRKSQRCRAWGLHEPVSSPIPAPSLRVGCEGGRVLPPASSAECAGVQSLCMCPVSATGGTWGTGLTFLGKSYSQKTGEGGTGQLAWFGLSFCG